jgi:quaternary ammonium compound-resistance protein SugE
MSWFKLIVAGLLEVGWAVGLPYTHGFTRLWPSVLVIAGIAASLWLLSSATREIPIGTAYAVWVGIGATGAAILGVLVLHEALPPLRALFLALLVISIVGLKLTMPKEPPVDDRAPAAEPE